MMNPKQIHAGILGLAIGDALGVPVEFRRRSLLALDPVSGMRAWGTHHQAAGTWSDDSSLTFCLADSLCQGYSIEDMACRFLDWFRDGIWTPHGRVFDIGIATREAMYKIAKGIKPELCGGISEGDNGNGSLMRILPMAFHLYAVGDLHAVYERVKAVSSITHAHFRSVFACFIYVLFAINLLRQKSKQEAYQMMQVQVGAFTEEMQFDAAEIALFKRILQEDISRYGEDKIRSGGYVLHSLEASLWCVMTIGNYRDAVLNAVNLGDDTDTTAAITGGLAGILYGNEALPKEWLEQLARLDDIISLCDRLEAQLSKG